MTRFHFVFALLVLSLPMLTATGQEKNVTVAKLKETAAEAMTKSEVKDARFVETTNFLLASSLPESRAKSVAAAIQKTYSVAAKALKFEDAEIAAFRGIVYVFSDLDQFRHFQRGVLKVRPEDEDVAASDVNRTVPFMAVTARRGEKSPKFELLAADELCRVLLVKKAGNARITEWMKDGFARAVQMRSNPGSIGSDRSTVARLAPRLSKNATATPVVDQAWSGSSKERTLVAASLMDFLTFGAGAEKLGNVLNGLIPSDGNRDPSFGDALKASDWMLEDLDRAWRDWIAKGSPLNK